MPDPSRDDDHAPVPPRHHIRDILRLPCTATAILIGTLAAAYALAFLAGYGFRLARFPLPWVLGPLAVTACFGFAGLPVQAVRRVRQPAQFVIGSAIGIQFTHAVVMKLLDLLPLIVATSLLSILACAAAAALMVALSGLDPKSAFFASAPAGVAEMANIALRYGGSPEPIMVSQTVRVVLCVTAAPFLVIHFTSHGALQEVAQASVLSWPQMGLVGCAAAIGGFLTSFTIIPNTWFVGSLLAGAVIGNAGLVEGRPPDWLMVLAQVSIGCSLGAQFRREFLGRLLPQMITATVTVLFSVAAMAAIAAFVAYVFALPVPTMVLALVPAGIAEMTLTGKVLGLDAAIISGFHMVRILMVMLLCQPACRWFERLYGIPPPAAG